MASQSNNAALAKPLSFEERLARVSGSFRNPQAVTERLEWAAKHCHLVSPATSCGSLPEGCAVAFATVMVDVRNETYDLGGNLGLSRSALDKIAGALGISWDAKQSRRLDDGSDSRYVHYKAVGQYRHFDGTIVQCQGEKEMDLREGSAQLDALWEKYENKQRAYDAWKSTGKKDGKYDPKPGKPPSAQINEMRLHILAHAETKARLRAICNTGVRRSYKAEELKKPFVVARIMFTGQSADPALRAMFARGTMEAMLGSGRALYGAGQADPAPTTHAYLPAASHAPPPVGRSVVREDDETPSLRSHVDTVGDSFSSSGPSSEPEPKSQPQTQTQAGSTAAGDAKTPAQSEQPRSGVIVKFGKEKDVAIEDASDDTLDWYAGAIAKSINDPAKSRWKAGNEKDLAAIREEQRRRAAEDQAADREDDEHAGDEDDFAPEPDRGDDPNKW